MPCGEKVFTTKPKMLYKEDTETKAYGIAKLADELKKRQCTVQKYINLFLVLVS